MASLHIDTETLRAWQLSLRTKPNKRNYFQAGDPDEESEESGEERSPKKRRVVASTSSVASPPGSPVEPHRDAIRQPSASTSRVASPPGSPVGPRRIAKRKCASEYTSRVASPPGKPVGPRRNAKRQCASASTSRVASPPGSPVVPRRIAKRRPSASTSRVTSPLGSTVGPRRIAKRKCASEYTSRLASPPGSPVGPRRIATRKCASEYTSRVASPPGSPVGSPKSKKCKSEMMVIEEGDEVPIENEPLLGHVVWAPFGGPRSYHPSVVIKGCQVNLTTGDPTMAFVYWFSDSKISTVPRTSLLEFIPHFMEHNSKSHGKKHQQGVIHAIEELQRRAALKKPALMKMDPLKWALHGFPVDKKDGDVFKPGPDFQLPESILNRLMRIGAEIRAKVAKKETRIPKERKKAGNGVGEMRKGTDKLVKIKDVCIGCMKPANEVICKHPLFEGEVCCKCKELLKETLFATGRDGTHSYCAVCGAGGRLFVCDDPECFRVFCVPCVEALGGEDILRKTEDTEKWLCFLCQPFDVSSHGLLKPRPNWRVQLVHFFNVDHEMDQVPDLDYLRTRRPIRVLSLFDGIGTGLLSLKAAGIQVEVYYTSETDAEASNISQANGGQVVKLLGDVTKITKEDLKKIAPIDLVMGGSPCNEFSLANPSRRGFDVDGSGVLFFDFYRILSDLVELNENTHLFWVYENVASMRRTYRNVITRFLRCQPAIWDARHMSAQKRNRFFWGNIPGLYSTPDISDGLRKTTDLNNILTRHCQRQATVKRVRTVTTNSNSLMQGVGRNLLPVNMAGTDDTLWIVELERLFGFPSHYTDVGNLSPNKRRALLGRSWSVQVITAIVRPLSQYFATTDGQGEENTCDKNISHTAAASEGHAVDSTTVTTGEGSNDATSRSNRGSQDVMVVDSSDEHSSDEDSSDEDSSDEDLEIIHPRMVAKVPRDVKVSDVEVSSYSMKVTANRKDQKVSNTEERKVSNGEVSHNCGDGEVLHNNINEAAINIIATGAKTDEIASGAGATTSSEDVTDVGNAKDDNLVPGALIYMENSCCFRGLQQQ